MVGLDESQRRVTTHSVTSLRAAAYRESEKFRVGGQGRQMMKGLLWRRDNNGRGTIRSQQMTPPGRRNDDQVFTALQKAWRSVRR